MLLPGATIIEWLLPLLGAFLYTIWIYKEQLSSKQILKISLYKYLVSFVGMLLAVLFAKISRRPECLTFLDANTIESVKELFKEYDTVQVIFWSYVTLGFTYLVLSPVLVGIEYLSIKLGNKLGLSFLKNTQ